MSLNAILDTSLSGLLTNQTAIRTVSNNIANVNTEGYSRLKVNTSPVVLQGEAAGVKIESIVRVVDEFLLTSARTAASNTEEFSVQREIHDQMQGLLGNPDSDSSLAARIDQLFGSVTDLTLNPADSIRRQQFLSDLTSFLEGQKALGDQIQLLRGDTSKRLEETVRDANEILAQIHQINPLLARQKAVGGETGGVEGQMDQALKQLSELIDIQVERRSDGALRVSTGSGLTLIDATLRQLEYASPGIASPEVQFPSILLREVDAETLAPVGAAGTDMALHIRSGRVQGLLDVRDKQLSDLSITLGELSARVRDELNRIHNSFSAVPPPNSLTGMQTFVSGNQATNFSGALTFAIMDGNSQLVSKTTIDFTGSPPSDFNDLITQVNTALGGNGTLALNNGVMSFTATNATHGVALIDDANDPTDRGGRGFSHFFGMNDLVTSDNAGIYETGFALTDALNIQSGGTATFRVQGDNNREMTTVTITPAGPTATVNDILTQLNDVTGLGAFFSFSFDANTGEINYQPVAGREGSRLQVINDSTQAGTTGHTLSSMFGLDDAVRAIASRDLRVVNRIDNDPDQLAMSVFDNAAAIGSVALSSGDQRGALALQKLETGQVSFSKAGEVTNASATLTQYTARFLASAGLMARRAASFEEDNLALKIELEQRSADISGVNMDEELANLVVYQNAYNAAARVLSSVQDLYDSLLSAV